MSTLVANDRITQRIHILESLAATAIAMRGVELEVEDEGPRALLHDALAELQVTIAELRELLGSESNEEDALAPESVQEDPVVAMVRERMHHR